jgi:hypothetical protein
VGLRWPSDLAASVLLLKFVAKRWG